MNTGVTFNLLMRQKKSSMEKIMRRMLEEVILSDRNMSDGQMYSYLKLFSTLKKLTLIGDWVLCNRLCVVYIHCDTALINNKDLKIYVHPT